MQTELANTTRERREREREIERVRKPTIKNGCGYNNHLNSYGERERRGEGGATSPGEKCSCLPRTSVIKHPCAGQTSEATQIKSK